MHKAKILFVDDEANVLSGLRRMLHTMRNKWELRFIQDIHEAIEAIESESFDIVVADMRMPQMSGADFLEKVSRSNPSCIRIILSGYSEKKMVLKTVPVAHQFLAKPVSLETLSNVINRSLALHESLTNPDLLNFISQIKSLPVLPDVYVKLVHKLQSEGSTPQEIAEIIACDVGMSAKIMQIINSAFFGLVRKVESLQQAIVYLGIDTIQALVLGVHIFNQMRTLKVNGLSMQAIVDHSLHVAELAKALAVKENLGSEMQESAFFAGLVHDCGIIILAQYMPEKYEKAVRLAEEKNIPLFAAEKEIFGVSHAETGAYLLNLWGLPQELVSAVAFHHSSNIVCKTCMDALVLVCIADYLDFVQNRSHLTGRLVRPDDEFLEAIGKEDKLSEWEHDLLQEDGNE